MLRYLRRSLALANHAFNAVGRQRFVYVPESQIGWELEQVHLRRVFESFGVDFVLDIGANRGQYARMLRTGVRYRGQIASFEPNPHASRMAESLAARDPLWEVEPIAVSDSDGQAILNVMLGDQFSSLSAPRDAQHREVDALNRVTETISVRTESLATCFARLRERYRFEQPFLKLDTQGYDLRILKSAPEVVHCCVGLQTELAIVPLYEDSRDFREVVSWCEEQGLRPSAFVPNNAGHFPRLLEMDGIFLREDLLTGP